MNMYIYIYIYIHIYVINMCVCVCVCVCVCTSGRPGTGSAPPRIDSQRSPSTCAGTFVRVKG